MRRMQSVALALSLGLVGCQGEESGAASSEVAPAPGTPAAPAAPAEPPGPRAASDTFELVAAPATGGYEAGQLGSFGIQLLPKEPWHVNVEYPIRVQLRGASEVGFAKSELVAEDAAELAEARARFDVPFTPSAAGEHRVEAVVSFGLCREESCIFEDRTLALALPVR